MKSLKDFLHKEIIEEGSPDDNGDGVLSPAELHHHLDIQKRGIVDLGDYAAHIMFHAHHPEYLAPVMEKFNDIQRLHAAGQEINPYDPVLSKLKDNRALVATSNPMMEGKTSLSRELDPPAVLIMRRKSVRQFPNGQRVALYYVDKINKYVTVPYEDMAWSSASEETVFDKVKQVNESKQNIVVEHLDGSTSEVTPQMAKHMMDLYKKINEANKAKMLDMLEASAKHFQTIAKFSKE
jgi:hypothetical protein